MAYVIPKIPGESSLVYNGTTFWPVTNWAIGPGISTGYGDSWIAGAMRYLMGEDSDTGAVHVLAQYSAYTRTGAVDRNNGYFLIRKLGSSITSGLNEAGVKAKGDFWSTTGQNQRQGYVYNIVLTGNFIWYDTPYIVRDMGTVAEGTTVTAATFYVGTTEVVSGVYQQTSVSLSYTVPAAPDAPTAITNTRNSDTQNTTTWTLPSTTYTRMRLQRLVDGSTVGAEWTFSADSGVLSYTDTGTAAAHSYTYRIRLELVPEAGEAYTLVSEWTTSSATYNTPAAPTAISGARTGASTVRVTLTNTATTSTGVEVQASTSSTDWSGAITTAASGAGVTSVDVTGLGGTYYFRARNTRGSIASSWSPVSDPVVTLVAPNPPTLTSPSSGAALNYSQSTTAALTWVHNPIDGSAQTAAQVQYSTDGGSTWTTESVTTAQSYTLTLTQLVGQTVTWRVRTKGAAADYSGWSSTRTFTVYPEPTLTIVLTDGNGNVVTNSHMADMPLNYQITATDGYTSFASGSVSIAGFSEAVTSSLTGSIEPSEVLLDNQTTYTFQATIQMTSGLQSSATVTVTTDYDDPQAATLAVTDADGIETLTVGLDPVQIGETAAESISVYRVTDGVSVLLASGLSAGATITDRYAPLNKPYIYRVRTYSAGGAARSTDFERTITTSSWMVISGDRIARGVWNPQGSLSFARPEKTRVQYIGRTYPVSYDGNALSQTATTTWLLLTMEERDAFIAIMAEGGRGVYKSCDGDVYMADYELRFSPAFTTASRYGTATLTITRIESGAL